MSIDGAMDEALDDFDARLKRLEAQRPAIDNHPADCRWDCERCGQLLGLVDAESGRMRFQVREFNVEFEPAEGTATTTKCKRCGWFNQRTALPAG